MKLDKEKERTKILNRILLLKALNHVDERGRSFYKKGINSQLGLTAKVVNFAMVILMTGLVSVSKNTRCAKSMLCGDIPNLNSADGFV